MCPSLSVTIEREPKIKESTASHGFFEDGKIIIEITQRINVLLRYNPLLSLLENFFFFSCTIFQERITLERARSRGPTAYLCKLYQNFLKCFSTIYIAINSEISRFKRAKPRLYLVIIKLLSEVCRGTSMLSLGIIKKKAIP